MLPSHSSIFRRQPLLFFVLALLLLAPGAASPSTPAPRTFAMQVTHVCLLTPQFAKMQDFYRRLLLLEPKKFTEDYVEFQTPGAIISLYDEASFAKSVPKYKPGSGPGLVMVELQVANVDQEYERLHSLGLKIDFLLPPTTFPWGNRSIYLRDPDGNLLNVYSTVPSP